MLMCSMPDSSEIIVSNTDRKVANAHKEKNAQYIEIKMLEKDSIVVIIILYNL